jgi:FkbM family methyltransferase
MSAVQIVAGGRRLEMTGPIQEYVDGFKDWNGDASSVSQAMKNLPRGSTFIDVGANVGFISCALAALRPDLRIIAIEPVPHNVKALRDNVARNGLTSIEIIHAGVSHEPGELRFTSKGPWSSVAADGEVRVDCMTLDDFASLGGFNTFDITGMKIDVEGWEANVLAGAQRLLDERCPLIHMEFNLWWVLNRHYDAWTFLDAIWNGSEMVGMYLNDVFLPSPAHGSDFLYHHIAEHGGVSDLLFRPRGSLGSLSDLVLDARTGKLGGAVKLAAAC